MTKLYEVKTTAEWTDLNTLTGHSISGIVELFNAGREGGVDILWTESASEPSDTAFCRVLKRQSSAVFTVGSQPIWVKSEASKAKLMISSLNSTGEPSIKGIL